ncbi:MAG: hypothetical protein J5I93_03895, partial [Pirellulaceae bacterium]|nr:hypothetical protein [Pirellulaceae bacterium]
PAADARPAPGEAASARAEPVLVVVVGAGGADQYASQFGVWADRWKAVAEAAGVEYHEIGRGESGQGEDRQTLRQRLAALVEPPPAEQRETEDNAPSPTSPLWLVLIGHGTWYRDVARFNLRGPDVSASELNDWLAPCRRPLVVINCASSSAPFLNRLSGPDRVLVTATRSGAEQNFARFGDYLSSAIGNPEADLDHDDQVSLLEAFLLASSATQRFYQDEGRLATEHALLDDNGDGLGTPGDFFRGTRAIRPARDGSPLDGSLARRMHLQSTAADPLDVARRADRDELERQLEQLRVRKVELPEEAYYDQLETLLVRLARLYENSHKQPDPPDDTEPKRSAPSDVLPNERKVSP